MSSSSPPLVYVVALEPSGDVLGSRFMTALRDTADSGVRIEGVGGQLMCGAGLKPLFDPSDLAILGIFEALPKARMILLRVREVLDDIERLQPDVLVTIDSWGFTGRLHKALAKRGSKVKRVRYVAPQVWAWRPGRARQLASWIDHLLTLFPFEPPLFEKHGLKATCVGHPVVEDHPGDPDQELFRELLNIRAGSPVLAVLPGSRMAEVKALMPVFGQVISSLRDVNPDIHVVIPTLGSVEPTVREWASSLAGPVHVVTGSKERNETFAIAGVAIAASGTVTLELAKAGVPHVIAYKVNPFSAFVFRRLAKTKYVNLVNILLGRSVVPECLQESCMAEEIESKVTELLNSSYAKEAQKKGFVEALSLLRRQDVSPSTHAAQIVLGLVHRGLARDIQ
ncbi:MAG: lipid-A-disaccharide synthase [Rhodospirillaceae bacterium]|nr:lipid-A-disaccharide synthase [Rhodospirillaceae bacterium]